MKSGKSLIQRGLCFLLATTAVRSAVVDPTVLEACPGYDAVNVTSSGSSLTAELSLRGQACNVFGTDVHTLKLQVDYETGMIGSS
jgi:alpha-glucosidase